METGARHTPGPFFYDGPNSTGARVIHVAEGEIAEVFSEIITDAEAEANALLFHAAPDLLALAIRAQTMLPMVGHHPAVGRLISDLSAAITKATGPAIEGI